MLVFNCDEGIDAQSINRIFIGLIQCGAWGCFDEFNRLEKVLNFCNNKKRQKGNFQNVLSTISSQVYTIQEALRLKSPKCRLDNEKVVSVNSNSALFITMNPADKEYRGRQKLPDTLKQLFRPVLMSAPDNTLISEILLFADGFNNAKTWSIKLNIVFELSK